VLDENKQPVKNLSLRFASIGDVLTTGSGEFIINIPEELKYVDISLSGSQREILYPFDSKIPVPEDLNFMTTVIVTNLEDNYDIDKSVEKYVALEKLLVELGTATGDLKSFLKRYLEIESRRLEIDEMKLREELEKREKQDDIFSRVSPILSEIILRLKNIKTAFETNYEIAFYRTYGIEYLNIAIRVYNPVFDTINNNYKTWVKDIGSCWNENVSEKFESTVSYMIDQIHKPYIFRLNESIAKINKIKIGIDEDEDKIEQMKAEVRSDISSILNELQTRIPILEKRTDELITRMQFSGVN
jgi:hypothetical protein